MVAAFGIWLGAEDDCRRTDKGERSVLCRRQVLVACNSYLGSNLSLRLKSLHPHVLRIITFPFGYSGSADLFGTVHS